MGDCVAPLRVRWRRRARHCVTLIQEVQRLSDPSHYTSNVWNYSIDTIVECQDAPEPGRSVLASRISYPPKDLSGKDENWPMTDGLTCTHRAGRGRSMFTRVHFYAGTVRVEWEYLPALRDVELVAVCWSRVWTRKCASLSYLSLLSFRSVPLSLAVHFCNAHLKKGESGGGGANRDNRG